MVISHHAVKHDERSHNVHDGLSKRNDLISTLCLIDVCVRPLSSNHDARFGISKRKIELYD